jgi:hypothetical protein
MCVALCAFDMQSFFYEGSIVVNSWGDEDVKKFNFK